MRLWVISDLHLRGVDFVNSCRGLQLPNRNPKADVLVVAGDIADGQVARSLEWLRREVPSMPIIVTLGNHDHYGTEILLSLATARSRAERLGIHLLENDAVEVAGVRFLGATLWTDYAIYERDEVGLAQVMATVQAYLRDHSEIWSALDDAVQRRQFSPADALELHRRSRVWIEAELAKPFAGKTVVVTHHAPHPGSIAEHYRGDPLTAAFVSDLSTLIERLQPDLWIHGHVHSSHDYRVGKTRVLANPHGYGFENHGGYRPAKLIEI